MLTVMFYTCFYRYFIEGPLYPSDIADAENCRHTWWNVMLMGSNMMKKDEICVSWTFAMIINFQVMKTSAMGAVLRSDGNSPVTTAFKSGSDCRYCF